jgi:hypothetical protein
MPAAAPWHRRGSGSVRIARLDLDRPGVFGDGLRAVPEAQLALPREWRAKAFRESGGAGGRPRRASSVQRVAPVQSTGLGGSRGADAMRRVVWIERDGGEEGNRTPDTRIFSPGSQSCRILQSRVSTCNYKHLRLLAKGQSCSKMQHNCAAVYRKSTGGHAGDTRIGGHTRPVFLSHPGRKTAPQSTGGPSRRGMRTGAPREPLRRSLPRSLVHAQSPLPDRG